MTASRASNSGPMTTFPRRSRHANCWQGFGLSSGDRLSQRHKPDGRLSLPSWSAPLKVDAETRSAAFDGQPLALTPTEFDLLLSLARDRGRLKTREQLLLEVAAGSNGALSVYVTNATDVILDINGYFDTSTGATSYAFYPATPCRVADTVGATGVFGGPTMYRGQERDFPIPLSSCSIPATARGYSLNVTAVPEGPLSYRTLWPTGQAQPFVSTLNSWTGEVVANAALAPTGSNEWVSVFVTDATDLVLDINGYFGQPGNLGALSFYPVTPCRIADTRGVAGPFGGPEMVAGETRSFAIPASGCNIPTTAAAYSMNVTVVPDGRLSFLSAWPAGSGAPAVSTLNSWDGRVVANAAIVPAGASGAINIFAGGPTHVAVDISGYFAP